jgi:hypothetical protein
MHSPRLSASDKAESPQSYRKKRPNAVGKPSVNQPEAKRGEQSRLSLDQQRAKLNNYAINLKI